MTDAKELVARACAAYDSGDVGGFRACLTDEWREYDGSGDAATFDDVAEGMRLHAEAFPDKRTTIEQSIAEDDLVVTRTTTTATHAGRYLDLEPTGKQVRLTEISIHRIEDGRIAETWQETSVGFYKQLTGRDGPAVGDNMA
jgi:predicted ester cyclase